MHGYNAEKDIALLDLIDNPIEFSSTVQPVCLPQSNSTETDGGENCVLLGWGNTGGEIFILCVNICQMLLVSDH